MRLMDEGAFTSLVFAEGGKRLESLDDDFDFNFDLALALGTGRKGPLIQFSLGKSQFP